MLDLAGITTDSIVDGPGIRVTIFCQGCPHRCPGCHNPETWEFGTGHKMTVTQVLDVVHSNPLAHGVTLSGGEPFSQAEELVQLTNLLKTEGYEIAAYTGYLLEDLLHGTSDQQALLHNLDVLIDGPFILDQRSLELNFRGSSNQRVLNVPASIASGSAVSETSNRWLGVY